MAVRGVDVNMKLAAVLARQAALRRAAENGARVPRVSVIDLCAELGMSRPTYYEAAARFAEHGLEGLLPRSRRPLRSPNQTPADVEDAVVAARKQLADEGWDNGATSIASRLRRDGIRPPAVSTINRILSRRGLVVAQPQKRPRSSFKRFNFSERNGCWQIDAFQWKLADGSPAAVFEILDDATRQEVDARAAYGETSDEAVACFLTGVDRHGVPAMLLSDNGVALNGALRGWVSALERVAAALGCKTVHSSPYHPQTCGKNERAHQTCQRWLSRQPSAATLTELQAQLDTYRELYNTHRPHQALGGRTPAEAAAETPVATPGPSQPVPDTKVWTLKVSKSGDINSTGWALTIGRRYKGQRVTVISEGDHITVLLNNTVLREATLDQTRRYPPSNKPRQPATTPPLSSMS
jgi:transposase InsO family protein